MFQLYKELPAVIQRSLRVSLQEFMVVHLEKMEYGLVSPGVSMVDTALVADVIVSIGTTRFLGKKRWTKVDFELPGEDLLRLLRELEYELRRKKPTKKEVEEYKQVLRVLGREEELPLDYWLFKRRFYYLSYKAELVKAGSARG
ncbi:hypothetical protein [Bacillus cereus]|uniref:hypothetical protein n=1 Tax=Bacillus cereus TaxID=1396 RepID=UPI003012C881